MRPPQHQRHAQRQRRVGKILVTNAVVAACVGFFVAAATTGHAQTIPPPVITTNPSSSLTLPQQPETPVSPTTPGTLRGTTAPNIAVGSNPVTGAPCIGGGASAINGGLTAAPMAPNQPAQPGQSVGGLPPNTSIYSLDNQTPAPRIPEPAERRNAGPKGARNAWNRAIAAQSENNPG